MAASPELPRTGDLYVSRVDESANLAPGAGSWKQDLSTVVVLGTRKRSYGVIVVAFCTGSITENMWRVANPARSRNILIFTTHNFASMFVLVARKEPD